MAHPQPLDLAELDGVIHEPARLGVMALLIGGDEVEFMLLHERLGLTKGNLGAHLRKLEDAGYVRCVKSFVGRKTRTAYRIAPKGRAAFVRHVAALERVIKANGAD